MKHLWRVSGCFLARWCGEVSLVEFWVVCLISVRLLADFVALKCFWWNSGWWISGGFCGSGWFVVEVWVDWWNSGGISGEFLWLKVSGGFLVDFVALGCFWWNSWWDFWWILWFRLVCGGSLGGLVDFWSVSGGFLVNFVALGCF
jgi:hypothetical protein